MLFRWLIYAFWRPFEAFCHWLPLVPMKAWVFEPVPGVKCIRIGNFVTRALGRFGGYGYATCYLVDGELLVDTGFPWAARRFRRLLRELDAPQRLRFAVCTHYHEDHIGNNGVVVEATKAELLAHADALAEIRHPFEKVWYRRFLFGPGKPVQVHAAPPRLRTANCEFEVLHMPGHCPGHICLLETTKGWLFSGDLFISDDLDSQLGDANGPVWIESIRTALDREPAALLDGHGEVVLGKEAVREALQRKLDFLESIRSRVAEVAARGPASIQTITKEVFGDRSLTNVLSFSDGWLSVLTGNDFSRSNLIRTFVADFVLTQEHQKTRRG